MSGTVVKTLVRRSKRRIVHYVMIALLLAGWLIYQFSGAIEPLFLIWGIDLAILVWEMKKRIEES